MAYDYQIEIVLLANKRILFSCHDSSNCFVAITFANNIHGKLFERRNNSMTLVFMTVLFAMSELSSTIHYRTFLLGAASTRADAARTVRPHGLQDMHGQSRALSRLSL